MIAKKLIADMAQRFGYEVVPTWRMRGLPFAGHLSKIFERFGVDAVIDVGGNDGQYRDFLRDEVHFGGPLLTYEPQPDCFRKLAQRAKADPNWQVRNLALGSQPGELLLNIMQDSQFSSFLPPEHAGVGDFSGMNTVRDVVKVPVAKLDEDIDNAERHVQQARRLYLKADTQGFDLAVFRGAQNTLARVVALQTELSIQPVYQGMPNYREMIDELGGMGFELSAMFPVSLDAGMGLIEADGVFINRRFARGG